MLMCPVPGTNPTTPRLARLLFVESLLLLSLGLPLGGAWVDIEDRYGALGLHGELTADDIIGADEVLAPEAMADDGLRFPRGARAADARTVRGRSAGDRRFAVRAGRSSSRSLPYRSSWSSPPDSSCARSRRSVSCRLASYPSRWWSSR